MDLKREVDMEIYTGLKEEYATEEDSDTSSAVTMDLELGT